MSPDPQPGRVIRGRVADRASSLAFPTIEAVEPVQGAPAHVVAPFRAAAPDPDELERARLEASARGYADGLAAGRDEARAEVLDRADALLRSLAEVVERRRAEQLCRFDEVGDEVARFAFEVVEALLGRELELAANPTRDAFVHALRLAPERVAITVCVHPGDATMLTEAGALAGGRAVEVVGDESMAPGRCLVRAGDTEIDVHIDAALARVRAVLAEATARGASA